MGGGEDDGSKRRMDTGRDRAAIERIKTMSSLYSGRLFGWEDMRKMEDGDEGDEENVRMRRHSSRHLWLHFACVFPCSATLYFYM